MFPTPVFVEYPLSCRHRSHDLVNQVSKRVSSNHHPRYIAFQFRHKKPYIIKCSVPDPAPTTPYKHKHMAINQYGPKMYFSSVKLSKNFATSLPV